MARPGQPGCPPATSGSGCYRDFIERNADSIRENATSQHGEIGLVWHAAFDEADPIRQSSGLDAVVAALRVAGVR